MTDEALMLEVSKNNIDSASILYDRYSKRLYNYFLKISFDPELSSDLLQNTFLRMIKYRKSFRPGSAFQSWVFRIARNVHLDEMKKRKLITTEFTDAYALHKSADENESKDQEQKEKNLLRAMQKLSSEEREILVLSRFQDMKYEQIASLLNLTVSAVKVKVHRAIRKLKVYYLEIERI